ncbi:MAG: hypothetical protein GY839_20665 [candidate division Zixibacteria bacterium]|nr:hypothetical protein [candidate division Zixibacteria bacterium]
MILVAFSIASAGESFKYKFEPDEVLAYAITIDSDLEIRELGSLAQLLSLDRIKHNVEIEVDLLIESVSSDGEATIRAIFRRISMITVAGDSAYVDDGSSWGAIKPGSEYNYIVSPRGKIIDFFGPDSVAARQATQMIERFFPVFPNEPIDSNYSWSDSIGFELEFPGEQPSEIIAQMTYMYAGKKAGGNHHFDFEATGSTNDSRNVQLSGEGIIIFDNRIGQLLENSGDFVIDAEISLAAFGLPSGLGTVPINIMSKIDIKLSDGK